LAGGVAKAQVAQVETEQSLFYEAPTRTHMLVYSPSAQIQASPWSWLQVRGGWEADVVSGASVSTKFGPAFQATHRADVVSTASVKDFRNLGRGELTIVGDSASAGAGYAYSTEHDYQSHALEVNAKTDALQHNTQLSLSFSHNFDSVCDRVQGETNPTRWVALENSTGCFTADPTRVLRPIRIDTFEASWTQAWTPVLETQLVYTAQIVNGFQSDPYRSVVLGEGVKAQEHEPSDRAREAVTGRVALYLRGFDGALRLSVRGYSDTWGIVSGTAEAELEKALGESTRVMVRGRAYTQTGAIFWSDDYTGGSPPLGPRGQYWTGDRELSPFLSWLAGVRGVWHVEAPTARILGFIENVHLVGSASVASFSYDEFTLGGTPISDAWAYFATASAAAAF
jgi:hypothetical protein